MELHVYAAFVLATAIMIALPGPSVLLTIAHSISFGCKHAIITVAMANPTPAIIIIPPAVLKTDFNAFGPCRSF